MLHRPPHLVNRHIYPPIVGPNPARVRGPGRLMRVRGVLGWRYVWVPAAPPAPAHRFGSGYGAVPPGSPSAQYPASIGTTGWPGTARHRTVAVTGGPPVSAPHALHHVHQQLTQRGAPHALYLGPEWSNLNAEVLGQASELAAALWEGLTPQQRRFAVVLVVMTATHVVAPGLGHLAALPFAKHQVLQNQTLHHLSENVVADRVTHGVHSRVLQYSLKKEIGQMSAAQAADVAEDTKKRLHGLQAVIAEHPDVGGSEPVQAIAAFFGDAVGLGSIAKCFTAALGEAAEITFVADGVRKNERDDDAIETVPPFIDALRDGSTSGRWDPQRRKWTT